MTLQLSNWQFRQSGRDENWRNSVPGPIAEVFGDLLYNNEIPDPFIDMNEKQVQWVGESDWEYKCLFRVEDEWNSMEHAELVFEGLDTFAAVSLNGEQILKTDNMFRQYKVNVRERLKFGELNTLTIEFDSALLTARELEKKNGRFACWNGETCRLHIRKAQYHFGWDWGPVLMSCGPYKPVTLRCYDAVVDDLYVKADVGDDLNASVDVQLAIIGDHNVSANVSLLSPEGVILETVDSHNLDSGTHLHLFELKKPALWYPWTIGTPALHTVKVEITKSGTVVQTLAKKVGFRKVELVQEPMAKQEGTSFYFRVNGVPLYAAGSNWIPAHSFLTKLTDQDYTDWLNLAVLGNQAMIRVWGGGYYEHDIFYEECDRLGLLVWQDFMFACGQYPAHPEFVASIKEEVTHQLKRLRNYACLAIFAGNNEDYQIAEQLHLGWDPSDHSGDYSKTAFPARTIYEVTLPNLMSEYMPHIPYHPGSPWGGEKPTSDQTVGDLHQWNVWHGTQEKYQDWYKLGGRFVSEFGMESLPSLKTYKACITDADQLYPQSQLVDHHNKADGFERRLALYIIENIKVSSLDMRSWIYASQLMQAECLAYAYRCWRRAWTSDGKRYSGGALVWQINDCWPVASWSIVDFYRRPKLAFYAIKRESAALGLGMLRKETTERIAASHAGPQAGAPHDYRKKTFTLAIWGVNTSLELQDGLLQIDYYSAASGERTGRNVQDASLKANGTTEFYETSTSDEVIVHASFVSDSGTILASASDWPQPLKYLLFPGRDVAIEVKDGVISLSTNKPIKGVEILLEDDILLEDNGFDLFPGVKKLVKAPGLKATDVVEVQWYQKDK